MDLNNEIFEALSVSVATDPVHSNTHNHALVHNPFAWEEESAEETAK